MGKDALPLHREARRAEMCTLDPRTRDPSIIIHGAPCKRWNGVRRVICCTSAYLTGVLLKKITFPVNMFIFAQPIPCSVLAAVVSGLSTLLVAPSPLRLILFELFVCWASCETTLIYPLQNNAKILYNLPFWGDTMALLCECQPKVTLSLR